MPSEGEDGVKLQQIRDGVEALEARTGSLDEATKLHGEIDNLHAELIRLWAHSLGRIPFPKMR